MTLVRFKEAQITFLQINVENMLSFKDKRRGRARAVGGGVGGWGGCVMGLVGPKLGRNI